MKNKKKALDLVREIRVRIISIEIAEETNNDNAEMFRAISHATYALDALLEAEPSE